MSGHYDTLITNTMIADGTGAHAFAGSIGIEGERITAVGQLDGSARRIIDGTGMVTCPGFVDPHTHADTSILRYPLAENLVAQGVTTCVGGNCGFSMAPVKDPEYFRQTTTMWGAPFDAYWRTFGEWLSAVDHASPAINYVPLVGHNTLREAVMGADFRRRARPDEIAEMEGLAQEAMQNGAFGLSVGLDASWSGHFAGVEELVALAKVARAHGGLFAPHTRHHQNQWPADSPAEFGYGIFHAPKGEIIVGRYHGLLEALEIARQADGIQLHIAHLTSAYIIPQPHPAFLDEAAARATLVDLIDRASDEGLDITFNVVAWDQSVGSRVAIIDSFLGPHPLSPDWLQALDRDAFVEQLGSRAFRTRLTDFVYSGKFKFGMIHPLTDPYWMDCYRVLECADPSVVGQTVGDLARAREPHHIIDAVYEHSLEVLFDILIADAGATWALIKDKREAGALPTFLTHPAGMPCSDVQAFPACQSGEHALYGFGDAPIAYGLFPHYIRHFVKETGVLTLEEAVRKASFLPAQRVLGLTDRGVIREGAYADLALLDFGRIEEGGDFLKPARPPRGIEYVLVNGALAYEKGVHTGARTGRVLQRRHS